MKGFRGTVVDFPAPGKLRVVDDGVLLVDEGRIAGAVPAGQSPQGVEIIDHSGCLIVPGFVDAHVHYPQTDVIVSHATHLLDWLERHTFPAETRFCDPGHGRQTAAFFLDELLRNGTTTAAVYPTMHPESVDAFFAEAQKRRLRMACGKVMMDRHSPEALRDEAERSYGESKELIERWHGRARLSYVVTPRFAATSTERQLELAGRLLDEHPGVLLQTHISENVEEIQWIRELYPDSKDYLDVYERFGLVRRGSLFAHCIHFSDDEWARLAAAGAAAVHCPTSNLFLGSGLFDLARARQAGALVSLGTDIGGGTSFSMLRTMHEAYKVAQLRRIPFTAPDAFYLATLGGAKAVGMDDRIGSFEPGREADFVVLRLDATPLMARRMACTNSVEERLFVLMMLGDDRAVAATFVLGEQYLPA